MVKAEECLFCKMAHGSISVPKVYEDERFFCIRDIHPQAKIHLLVIPKEHVPTVAHLLPSHGTARNDLAGEMLAVGVKVAESEGMVSNGFRFVLNTNAYAGQTVFHIHLHVLGGEPLKSGFA